MVAALGSWAESVPAKHEDALTEPGIRPARNRTTLSCGTLALIPAPATLQGTSRPQNREAW